MLSQNTVVSQHQEILSARYHQSQEGNEMVAVPTPYKRWCCGWNFTGDAFFD